jgi:uncharacterized membrane protein
VNNHVLYLGDDDLTRAAGYLATVLAHHRIQHIHVPTETSLSVLADREILEASAIIVSDYSYRRLSERDVSLIATAVDNGSGLFMIGGWGSFGNGGFHGTPIEERLPVTMKGTDDRMNCAHPCVMARCEAHQVVDQLPFDRPPAIGGYNQVVADNNSITVLEAIRFRTIAGETIGFEQVADPDPLLVLSLPRDVQPDRGLPAAGRSAAFMTDVAPHWVGGLVDWGDARVRETVAGREVEVGNWYARLLRNIVVWVSADPDSES